MSWLAAYASLNIKPSSVFKLIATDGLSFGIAMTYLCFSQSVSFWTAFCCALIFSQVFTVCFMCSASIRCSVCLFFVQIFSQFGLLMMFLSVSWMIIQEVLEDTTAVILALVHENCLGNALPSNVTEATVKSLKSTEEIMAFLHYCNLAPYGCIFIYTLLYQCTYTPAAPVYQRRSPSRDSVGTKKVLKSLAAKFAFCVVGAVISLTFGSCYLYVSLKDYALQIVHREDCKKPIIQSTISGYVYFYLGFIATLTVLLPFSPKILEARPGIVARFFKFSGGNREPKQPPISFMVDENQRVPLRTIVRSQVETNLPDKPGPSSGKPSLSSDIHRETKREKKERANHPRTKHDHQMDLEVLSDAETSDIPSAEICEDEEGAAWFDD